MQVKLSLLPLYSRNLLSYYHINFMAFKQFILFFLIVLTFTGYSQSGFNYGPEVGVVVAHFPFTKNYSNYSEETMETTTPIVSPLIGFQTQYTFVNQLQLTAGLQYQMSGSNFHAHRDGNIPRDNGIPIFYSYTYDKWETQRFHKISLPLTIGYKFNLGRFYTTPYVGLRPNLYFAGAYTYKTAFDASDNAEDLNSENAFDPLDKNDIEVPVRHLQYQFNAGMSTEIGPRFKVALNYSRGPQITYAEYEGTGDVSNNINFINQDISCSVIYLLADIVKVAK